MQRKRRKSEHKNRRRTHGMGMTPEQRRWCEGKLGKSIRVKNEFGMIIDYKADTAGWGVYFIVQFDTYMDEVCRPYPAALRSRTKNFTVERKRAVKNEAR